MTDATPDFENMSPEQIQEWMESLARRQGATEGFTTSASMEVPEIDPSSVNQAILQDTYVPFGWSAEAWHRQLEKEEREKARRAAASPAPTSAAQPAASSDAPMMTPEQMGEFIMNLPPDKQFELLDEMGKSQRGEPNRLAELLPKWDQSSVDESSLGRYRPSYMSEQEWEAHQAKEAAAKQPARAASQPAADLSDVLRAPVLDDLFTRPAAQDERAPAASLAAPLSQTPDDLPAAAEPAAALDDPLQWLSQLGRTAPEAALPVVSFAELNRGLADIPPPAADDDPLQWLASLQGLEPASAEPIANLDTGMFNLGNLAEIANAAKPPAASDADDIAWLESVARANGASRDELVTEANLALPGIEGLTADGPGYQPYSFENAFPADEITPVQDDLYREVSVPDVSRFDDPAAWLDELAAGVNASRDDLSAPLTAPEPAAEDPMAVIRALDAGQDVSPQAMEAFFEKMFERAEQEMAEPAFSLDDAPPVEAEIPDWLQESFASVENEAIDMPVAQMLHDLGLTEEEFAQTAPLVDPRLAAPPSLDWQLDHADAPDPADIGLAELVGIEVGMPLDEEPIAGAIPDWLREQAEELASDMSDIFVDEDENTVPIELIPTEVNLRVDTNDPWVRAFAQESDQPQLLQEWYTYRVAQVEGRTVELAVEPAAELPAAAVSGLQPALLPLETVLTQAMPVTLPAWLSGEAVVALASAEEPVPDWIQIVEEQVEPSWMTTAPAAIADPAYDLSSFLQGAESNWPPEVVDLTPPPAVVIERTPPTKPVPSRPAAVPAAEVQTRLRQAREALQADLDRSLMYYESVVRANAALGEVVQDLNRVAADKANKSNPVVYRVLGDALMRQGNLQDALATYRKALNLL